MSDAPHNGRSELRDGSTIAVVGGGPAGSFFAIHLLREAARTGRRINLIIFERHRSVRLESACPTAGGWQGCNYCAGGISPKLHDVLEELGLKIPEEIIQCRIHSISIQGFWKNIELEVPEGREMLAVYRGSRPHHRFESEKHFDAFLLDQALQAGAKLMCAEVRNVSYGPRGLPVVQYRAKSAMRELEVDLVVFAAGVNEEVGGSTSHGRMLRSVQAMIPRFQPPRVRHALIFELAAEPKVP